MRGVDQLDVSAREAALGLERHERRARHRLDAAGQHQVGLAEAELAGALDGRLEAGGAEAVDGHAGHLDREARQQAGHAGHVAVVLAGLVGAAHVDLVDRGGVELVARDGGARPRGRPGRRGGRSRARRRSGRSACAARRGSRRRASAERNAYTRARLAVDEFAVFVLFGFIVAIGDLPRAREVVPGLGRRAGRLAPDPLARGGGRARARRRRADARGPERAPPRERPARAHRGGRARPGGRGRALARGAAPARARARLELARPAWRAS